MSFEIDIVETKSFTFRSDTVADGSDANLLDLTEIVNIPITQILIIANDSGWMLDLEQSLRQIQTPIRQTKETEIIDSYSFSPIQGGSAIQVYVLNSPAKIYMNNQSGVSSYWEMIVDYVDRRIT